jgi:transposase
VGDHIFENLDIVHPNAAGIDIGAETHYVCVPDGRDEVSVRTFGCYTPDLQAMAAWLQRCGITHVVMESTGVYWIPCYQVLQAAGLDVQLVDAHHAKNVPGRKTDVWDCRWLRKLHTFGLLRGCFLPPPEIQEVRSYWRTRNTLVQSCAQQIERMQKALEQMNVQIHKALKDISGVSGMRMLRAIVAGERDPRRLARMADYRVKASEEELVKALTGHYQPAHVFALKQALEAYDFLHKQMQECDEQIQACLARFEDKTPPAAPPSRSEGAPQDRAEGPPAAPSVTKRAATVRAKSPSRRKNEPYFDLEPELQRIFGVDLTRIEGISSLTAMMVLSEMGTDVSAFPTHKHLGSWLGLAPNLRITGGKVKGSRTRKVRHRLATAFRVAAQSLHASPSALGCFYRRMAARRGAPQAITATAYKLAQRVYHMLKYGTEYVEQGQAQYEAQSEQRRLRALHKQAAALGFSVVPNAPEPAVS